MLIKQISQKEKDKYHVFSLICRTKKSSGSRKGTMGILGGKEGYWEERYKGGTKDNRR